MGQQQSTEEEYKPKPQPKIEFKHNVVAPISDEEKKKKAEHSKIETKDGIMCSCGYACGTEHYYHLHIETHCADLAPIDGSGWPTRHFDTVPFVSLTQRGVVSKGNVTYAAFTFITLREDFDEKEVRKAIHSVPELSQQVGKIDKANELGARVSAFISVSPNLWKLWDTLPPAELVEFSDKCNAGDPAQVLFPRRPGKYQLFVLAKANRVDLCYELTTLIISQFSDNLSDFETTQGFAYMASHPYGGRDLTGFVDGTRNPDHLLRSLVDEVIIFPDDHENDQFHVGGCYMYAGRFVHDLKKFFSLPSEEKNHIIGRDHSTVRAHHGYDTRPENPRLGDAGEDEFKTMEGAPPRSHVARAFGSMQRQAYPYYSSKEQGLFFTAYARFLGEIDTALDRMCGKYADDKSVDNLLSITKAVENMYYYVPSLFEIERLDFDHEECYGDSTEKRKAVLEEKDNGDVEDNNNNNNSHKDVKGKLKIDEPEEKQQLVGKEEEKGEKEQDKPAKINVLVEYCTNCGYKTIFLEKKKILEAYSPNINVIGNPTIPRLAAFEISLEDGTILWSKLNRSDGRNNYPHVFPKNEQLVEKLEEILKESSKVDTSSSSAIYTKGTRVGVW